MNPIKQALKLHRRWRYRKNLERARVFANTRYSSNRNRVYSFFLYLKNRNIRHASDTILDPSLVWKASDEDIALVAHFLKLNTECPEKMSPKKEVDKVNDTAR